MCKQSQTNIPLKQQVSSTFLGNKIFLLHHISWWVWSKLNMVVQLYDSLEIIPSFFVVSSWMRSWFPWKNSCVLVTKPQRWWWFLLSCISLVFKSWVTFFVSLVVLSDIQVEVLGEILKLKSLKMLKSFELVKSFAHVEVFAHGGGFIHQVEIDKM